MLLALMLCSAVRVSAQQGVVFSQYVFNGLIINPAYAGYQECFNATVLVRSQWAGIESAPTTVTLLADGTIFNNNIGIGGHIMNDKVGAQQTLSIFSDYSYRIKVDNQNSRLSLGLSIGLTQLSLDENMVRMGNPNDPLLTSGMLHEVVYRPDFNIGAFFDHKQFSAGVAVTELWGDYKLVQKSPTMYATFSTLIPITRDYILKPSLMYKDDFKMQPSIDVNVFMMIKDRVWLGLSWRNGLPFKGRMTEDLLNQRFNTSLNALTFMGEVFVSENFYMGYAYDLALSQLNKVSSGSHEVMLGFKLGRKAQRVLTPRYF
jgi:type IX secretion system PorP/SprF family membrane protein